MKSNGNHFMKPQCDHILKSQYDHIIMKSQFDHIKPTVFLKIEKIAYERYFQMNSYFQLENSTNRRIQKFSQEKSLLWMNHLIVASLQGSKDSDVLEIQF